MTPSLPTFSIPCAIRSPISWAPFANIVPTYTCWWQSIFFTIGGGIVNVNFLLRNWEFAKQELGLIIARTNNYIFEQQNTYLGYFLTWTYHSWSALQMVNHWIYNKVDTSSHIHGIHSNCHWLVAFEKNGLCKHCCYYYTYMQTKQRKVI